MTLKDTLAAAAQETRTSADLLVSLADHLRRQALAAHALVAGASGEDARAMLAALQAADQHLEAAATSLGAAQRRIEEFNRTL